MANRFLLDLLTSAKRCAVALFACACSGGSAISAEPIEILPGDARFKAPAFEDFEVRYGSTFSKNGAFTLQVRNVAGGAKTHIMDIIPGEQAVIVAFRMIDAASQRIEFSAGPYFAWGQEFVVQQASPQELDMTRIPIGGGEPVRQASALPHGGFIADTFSPTLAALMPMEAGTKFRLPLTEPRADQSMANVFADFEVIGREKLTLDSGVSCDCWIIEEKTSSMPKSRIWVSREAPFFYRWHRDIGGQRDFVSEVLSFKPLK